MRPLGNHIHAAILRAIGDSGAFDATDREKPTLTAESMQSTDWASATFIGATHDFDLRITGSRHSVAAALCLLVGNLPDRNIPIAGHIVAEVAVIPGTQYTIGSDMIANSLTVNVLTIMD